MTVGAKNNYARAIKLDLTFLALVSIFLKFSLVFLAAEEDYKTYKQKQSEVNELTTTYTPVRRHAQQQDKLNAKKLIHGICSIFRLFLYKLILNLYLQSLTDPFLVQHSPTSQPRTAEKKDKTSAKRHDDIVTPQLPRYNKLDSSSSENTSAEIRPISCVLGVSSDEADEVTQRTVVSKE